MKKNVFTVILILGLSTAGLFAQKKGDVEFGVGIGFNRSLISNSENSSDAGSGINVACSFDYYFSPSWSIKGKLIYDQKGWDNDLIYNADNDTYYPTNYNLNYLTVPVMANWHFGRTKNWYLNFGPYVGFLLSAKDTRFDSDVKQYFNSNDFGLAVGIGVKIPVSKKLKLFIEYDGQGGMMDIAKGNQGSSLTNSRSAFNVGLNFLLK